jgi:phage terminase small subunit
MAGRPRKPTAVQQLKGANKVNPERWDRQGRKNEPKPLGPLTFEPPIHLTQLQKEAYRHLVDNAHPKVLCQADSAVVEMGAVLLARFRSELDEYPLSRYKTLLSILDRLGMTPSARSKVQAMPDNEDPDGDLKEFH